MDFFLIIDFLVGGNLIVGIDSIILGIDSLGI